MQNVTVSNVQATDANIFVETALCSSAIDADYQMNGFQLFRKMVILKAVSELDMELLYTLKVIFSVYLNPSELPLMIYK